MSDLMKDLDTMQVGAGDVLVIRPRTHIPFKDMLALHETAGRMFQETGIKVVLIDHGVDLGVIKEKDLP